jgi:Skp family chaperone for outer membrane proteins
LTRTTRNSREIKAVNVEQIAPVEVDQEEVEDEIETEIEEVENDNTVPATPSTPTGRLTRELQGLMEFNRDPV